MAHKILYTPDIIVFPSDLDNISIQVDGPYVDVLLSRSTGSNSVTVFSERFYPFNGVVTLCDLASLVIEEMRAAGLSYSIFSLKAFSDSASGNADSKSIRVVFCDRFSVAQDKFLFAREHFLTTLTYRRVAPNSTLLLSLFVQKADSLAHSINYVCQKPDGSSFTHSMTIYPDKMAHSSDVVELNIEYAAILQDAASFSGLAPDVLKLLSFSVNCGKRAVTCFVDPLLDPADSFIFRNCFNARECVCLPVVTSAKTTVDRSTALINGFSNFYDSSTEKIYDVQAGPLTHDEADWIDQLFSSYDVLRPVPGDGNPSEPYILTPVLITDSTCEISDSDDKPNTVKFSWRHTSSRPMVRLPYSPGIFSLQFDFRFS